MTVAGDPALRAASALAALTAAVALLASAGCGQEAASTGDVDGGALRGGTLRVDSAASSYVVDPAMGFSPIVEATQLTLVGLVDGTEAVHPVPEAAGLPRVSPDGLTYTFTIRRGFRFSDGTPVTAANFAYAFNRVLAPGLGGYPSRWLADVVGADAVAEGQAAAARGIVARGNTLTIRLRRPSPELLTKLALPSFGAVPLGFPVERGGVARAPLHSAGPYYVQSFLAGYRTVLARNPFWPRSLVPRRPARVDRVVVRFRVLPDLAVRRVEGGGADLTTTPDPERWRELVGRFGLDGGRVFRRPRLDVYWLAFNHERSLFDGNATLRRAVNLALDRRHLLRQAAFLVGTPTDQLLPPGMPGFRDHRLYPLDGSGLERARALARGALRGGTAVLWAARADEAFAEVVRYDLRRMGLDVRLELLPVETLLGRLQRPGQPWDLVLTTWIADYPDPANVLDDGLTSTPGGFRDAGFDRKLTHASELTGAARSEAFALLDREVMLGDAPVAPIMALNSGTFVSARVGCVDFGWHGFVRWDAVCLR